jgi:hypothetical protein
MAAILRRSEGVAPAAELFSGDVAVGRTVLALTDVLPRLHARLDLDDSFGLNTDVDKDAPELAIVYDDDIAAVTDRLKRRGRQCQNIVSPSKDGRCFEGIAKL